MNAHDHHHLQQNSSINKHREKNVRHENRKEGAEGKKTACFHSLTQHEH